MINLLPTEHKRELQAAHTNVLLRRYVFLSVVSALFLGLVLGSSYVVMAHDHAIADATLAENKRKASAYNAVEQQANSFRSNLATAKTILDKQVNYTKVVLAIAQVLPANVILDNLDLDAKTFGSPFSLSAHVKSYNDALNLKDTLAASKLFSNVYLESISNGAGTGTKGYPIDVKLNVTIRKEVANG